VVVMRGSSSLVCVRWVVRMGFPLLLSVFALVFPLGFFFYGARLRSPWPSFAAVPWTENLVEKLHGSSP
jgi:hypothetical protein